MSDGTPTLYVIAGPNGIGKSTSTFDLIPAAIPIINSDEINRITHLAGPIEANMQEYSNREALRLVNEHLTNRTTFGIETNLADNDTWRFLLGVQKQGYFIHLLFLCTDSLEVLNSRINERHMRGEHFVRPDVVRERYLAALNLLAHYFRYPDKLQLFDNGERMQLVGERNGDTVHFAAPLPAWANTLLEKQSSTDKDTEPGSGSDSIEAVRQRYRDSRGSKAN